MVIYLNRILADFLRGGSLLRWLSFTKSEFAYQADGWGSDPR